MSPPPRPPSKYAKDDLRGCVCNCTHLFNETLAFFRDLGAAVTVNLEVCLESFVFLQQTLGTKESIAFVVKIILYLDLDGHPNETSSGGVLLTGTTSGINVSVGEVMGEHPSSEPFLFIFFIHFYMFKSNTFNQCITLIVHNKLGSHLHAEFR